MEILSDKTFSCHSNTLSFHFFLPFKHYNFSIIPVLSKTQPTNRKEQFLEPFLKMRQESLDRFLQRVIHHSQLVNAPCLLPFFTANAKEWKDAKEDSNSDSQHDKDLLLQENTDEGETADIVAVPEDTIHIDAQAALSPSAEELEPKKGRFGKWLANRREQRAVQNTNMALEETPAEAKKFADLKTHADHLEVCVKILSEDFRLMQDSQRVVAEKTGTMGASFAQLWGEHELSNTSSSTLYQTLGEVWARISTKISQQGIKMYTTFESPLDDLVLDVMALQDALKQRRKALYEFTSLTQEGQSLNKQLDRIRQSGNLDNDRYFKLEARLRYVDDKTAKARSQSDLVTTRLEKDVDRFRIEWHERMRAVLEKYHEQQVKFLQDQATEFSSVLDSLQKSSLATERSGITKKAPTKEKLHLEVSYDSGGAKAVVVGDKTSDTASMEPPSSPPPLPPTSAPPPLPPSSSPSFDKQPSAVSDGDNDFFDADDGADGGFDADASAMGGASPSKAPVMTSI